MRRILSTLSCLVILSACGGQAAAPSAQPSTGAATTSAAAASPASAASTNASTAAKPAASGLASAKPAAGGSAAAKPVASGAMLIPFSQPAAAFAPTWLAVQQGLFAKYGINADVRNLQPPTDVQSVVSGEAPMGVDGSLGIGAIASGAGITYIAVPGPIFTQSVFAGPNTGIQDLKGLVGKSVAVTSRGGSSDNALHSVLAKEGVDATKVNFVYLRDDSAILASLTSGAVQAAILTSPNTLRAKQAGLKELVYMPPLKLQTVNNGIVANKAYAAQHPDVVENFLKAYIEAIKIARTDPDTTKKAITAYTKVDDPALLDESYKTSLTLWVPYPRMNDAEFQNVMDLAVEPSVRTHKPSEFYDNSYLDKLQDFVKTLYPEGLPSA
ncbi:MAG TPA: ABC transporter substrate-binding protein [Chloroflexota bacterium]|nr:ABC transporter substrate-binding protein [Chloroflexota bacterium]